MTSTYEIEIVPNSRINLGEGPHWDIETQSLYYIDIYGGAVFRYDYNEKKIYTCEIVGEKMVSFIIPINSKSKNEFAIGAGRKVAIIKWDGKASKVEVDRILFTVEDNKPNNRFNDAKCDPHGRLFAGTMRLEILDGDVFDFREGNLYRYINSEKGVEKIKNDVGISNGLDWNAKLKKMYFIDSVDMNVVQYDYDETTGNIDTNSSKQLIHFDGKPHVVPDGMTIDDHGNLYIAMHGSGKVVIVEPKNGRVIKEIHFPSKLVTSCAFGGPNLDILFVTSAHKGKENSPAGCLYMVKGLKAKGIKMNKFNLN